VITPAANATIGKFRTKNFFFMVPTSILSFRSQAVQKACKLVLIFIERHSTIKTLAINEDFFVVKSDEHSGTTKI